MIKRISFALGMAYLYSPLSALAAAKSEVCKSPLVDCGRSGSSALEGGLNNVINIIIFIVGIAAVIMIIVGGLRYVLAGGDAGSAKTARDTILYSVIGLIVAVIAYGLVNFVIGKFA